MSPLSQYLTYPSSSTTTNATTRDFPKARLLTSDECLAELEEKERKKQQAAEEKERKKKEREEKRKQRQQLLQEKKRQKEENIKKKAEEKAKKAQEKAQKGTSVSNTRQRAGKRTIQSVSAANSEASKRTRVASMPTSSASSASSSSHGVASTIAKVVGGAGDEDIDPNICCMCFVTFEEDTLEGTGAEWIPCPCGRWLHEDCVKDYTVDSDRNEHYCPFCVDSLTIS